MTDQEINEKVARKLGKITFESDGSPCYCEMPDYSTSIEAAWEIVERNDHYVALKREKGVWFCSLGIKSNEWSYADTATMAICLAFLKLP